jgi:hypothetical protein
MAAVTVMVKYMTAVTVMVKYMTAVTVMIKYMTVVTVMLTRGLNEPFPVKLLRDLNRCQPNSNIGAGCRRACDCP